jgi:uncharacterized membrane protein
VSDRFASRIFSGTVVTEQGGADELERMRESYARNVDNRVQAAMLGVLAVAAMLYPVVIRWATLRAGTRSVALVFLVAGVVAMLRAPAGRERTLRVVATLPAAAALLSGSILPLLWVPVLLHAMLAYLFLASLDSPMPLVERVARTIQPAVPDFVAPYCRHLTALWGVVFVINAVVLAMTAATLPLPLWERYATWGVWSWMAAITVVEFFVRKTYFRNYWYRGPFERFWSKLFPAEATEMGRRSAEHIRQTRKNLGLDD